MKFLENVPLTTTRKDTNEVLIKLTMSNDEFKEYNELFKDNTLAEIDIARYPR